MSSSVYTNIRVKQSLSVHPLTHVQLLGAVHCLLVPHEKLQIAVLLYDCIMSSIVYTNIHVKQSLLIHPITHVQLLGAVHCLLVPQGELQIAVLL